jgi:predicted phage baseplate assembly protein
VVTVILVPNMPVPMPRPSDGLLAAVRRRLNRRRAIGTRVEVVAPGYLQVAVNATVQSVKGQNQMRLQQTIIAALNAFLDPLSGGPDGTGWPFGRDVYETEILQILAQTPGVDHVNSMALAPTGCEPQCGNICLKPTWLVTPGQHRIEVL